jgi:hypothetical protein
MRGVQIDVRLDEIVLRALEAKPELRFQTAAELRTRLEDLGSAAPGGSVPPKAAEPVHANPWSRRSFWLIAACAALGPALLVVILVIMFVDANGGRFPGLPAGRPHILLLVTVGVLAGLPREVRYCTGDGSKLEDRLSSARGVEPRCGETLQTAQQLPEI